MKYPIVQKILLGNHPDSNKEYRIVGAGMSGLLLGYHMKKKGIPFTIHEKGQSAGGLIKTHKVEDLGWAEQAANGFIWCDELAELCEDLGMDIQSPDPSSKARYLVRENRMRKFPLGIAEAIAMTLRIILPHRHQLETVEDFGHTFLGKTMTNQVLEPAFAGIYGAPISDLSFSAVLRPFAEQLNHTNHFPTAVLRWRKQVKANGSSRKKLSGTQSFKGGFGELPKRLAEHLDDHIRYGSVIDDVRSAPTILTTPAHISRQYLDGPLADLLGEVRYTPIITTTLFFKKTDVKRFKEGFGCLIPRSEGLEILGVLFNSCIFPDRVEHEDILSLTCIFRDNDLKYLPLSENEILQHVLLPDLSRLLGIDVEPLGYKMFKWEKGIPVYSPGLAASWQRMDTLLKQDFPEVGLLGNYTGQISVRGMAQFVHRAFGS